MRLLFLILTLTCNLAQADESSLLKSTIQTQSESYTGQTVSIDYHHLNIYKNWALAYGQILGKNKKELDWSSVTDCDHGLDKGLWAVLKKTGENWSFIEYEACAIEPPYWYIDLSKNTWPCEIFKGLVVGKDLTLEDKCIAEK